MSLKGGRGCVEALARQAHKRPRAFKVLRHLAEA